MGLRNFLIAVVIIAALIGLGFGIACLVRGDAGAVVDLMRETPHDTDYFVYADTKAMADDSDLHGLLDIWKAQNETRLEGFGISTDTVTRFLEFPAYDIDEGVLVLRGDYERERVRAQLRNRNYNAKDWKHVEVWESADGANWLAVTEDSLIAGNRDRVRECINVIEGESSLYDDQDAREVVDRLPRGIMMSFVKYTDTGPYEGLLAYGDSYEKKDRERLKVRLVYKFGEPEDATRARETIRDDVDEGFDNVDAKQDGRFIIVTGEVRIEYFLKYFSF